MWFRLQPGARQRVQLHDRQAVWPAPDGSDAEFILDAEVQLTQEVLIATPRLLRLRYRIDELRATMALDEERATPWTGLEGLHGHAFEVMITERGPIVVPGQGPKVAPHLAGWLGTISEDMRCAWPLPPDHAAVGTEWRLVPVIPGGLPARTSRADVDVTYTLTALAGDAAEVAVRFAVRVVLEESTGALTGEGDGTMTIAAERDSGVTRAARRGALRLGGVGAGRQVIRSEMELARVG